MTLCPLRLDIDRLDGSPSPIDIDLIKKHSRIDFTDDDDLLPIYLIASIEWAEGQMKRTVFARQHRWVLKEFPRCYDQSIRLPRGKTQGVTSIAYSLGGTIHTLRGPSSGSPAGNDYQEDLSSDSGGVLMPLRGSVWPDVDYDVPAPVTITFSAGWQTQDVPQEIIQALMFAVGDCYEMRSSADLNNSSGTNPKNFDARMALISGYMAPRWY